jgi:ATP-binding protein involved in chromosome partitioning
MPPGTGDIQLSLAQLVPMTGAVLVTTPQEVAVQDVRKAYRMFEHVKVPVLGFVENMSYFVCDGCDKKHFIFGKDGGDRLKRRFGKDVLAHLPIDPQARQGGDEGYPISVSAPDSVLGHEFSALASKVWNSLEQNAAASQGPEINIQF